MTNILQSVLFVLIIHRSACVHVGFADDADTSEARCIRSPASVVKDFVSHFTWNSTPVLWKQQVLLVTRFSLQPMTNIIFFITLCPELILCSHILKECIQLGNVSVWIENYSWIYNLHDVEGLHNIAKSILYLPQPSFRIRWKPLCYYDAPTN